MAAGNWIPFTQAVVETFQGAIDWRSTAIRCTLHTSSYSPAQDTDSQWGAASGSTPHNTEVSGTGYTSGGIAAPATPTVTNSSGTTTAAMGTAIQWTSSTITAKYAILTLSTGGATIGTTDKLLAYCLLDSGGANVSTTNGTFSISGWSVAITHNAS